MGVLEELGLELLWFDSMGAKSASVAVRSSAGLVVVDPGAAEMQPGYPLSPGEKRRLRREAIARIMARASGASVVVVTHYHYDHHVLPGDPDLAGLGDPYRGRRLVLKNPNKYINGSQWRRARRLLGLIVGAAGGRLEDYEEPPGETSFPDPVEGLEEALSRSFGGYDARRRELLGKGRRWFESLTRLWARGPWVREGIELGDGTRIEWCDGAAIDLGDVRLRSPGPWFHGVEYDRTGWVCPLVIEARGRRVFYTSDLMGPIIEDYAYAIADEEPAVVIADGPPTYLYPYMLNRVNLGRAVENMIYILEAAAPELVIYDHHLLREKRWRERIEPVIRRARELGVELLTAAEYMGSKPVIDRAGG